MTDKIKQKMINREQWLFYIEARLTRWAEWHTKENELGLGYPSRSLEYRLLHEGIVMRSSHSLATSVHCQRPVEEVEALMEELSRYHHPMAIALCHYYFSKGSLREKAKGMKISHVHYKHLVDLAHQWLIGRLSRAKH